MFYYYNITEEERVGFSEGSFTSSTIWWWNIVEDVRKKKMKPIMTHGALKQAMRLDFGVDYLEGLKKSHEQKKSKKDKEISIPLGKEYEELECSKEKDNDCEKRDRLEEK